MHPYLTSTTIVAISFGSFASAATLSVGQGASTAKPMNNLSLRLFFAYKYYQNAAVYEMECVRMAKMTQITPFILCRDLQAEIAFFERLGFVLGFLGEEDSYAFMRRENVAVRLLGGHKDLSAPECEQMVYIDVDDVDALWDEIGPKVQDLPEARWRAPFNQPYNQREFHLIDEDACLLMFGMAYPYPDNPEG